MTPTPAGRLRVRGEVDQVTGALLTTLVEAGAAPRPTTPDGPDPRPACTRRAHALGDVLRVAANAADSVSGGLNAHLLITMTLDSLRDALTTRGLPTTLPAAAMEGGAPTHAASDGREAGEQRDGERLAAEHPALFAALRAAARAASGAAGAPHGNEPKHGDGCGDSGCGSAGSAASGATRMAVLETGVPISAGWARRLACDATIIPLVLGKNSEPLDIGRANRLIPTALRRALVARDKHCAFPGCRRPPRWCDAHHILEWLRGGETCLDNLVLLCEWHHQLIHHSDWTVKIVDGRPLFTPPAWLDPLQRPRPPTDLETP